MNVMDQGIIQPLYFTELQKEIGLRWHKTATTSFIALESPSHSSIPIILPQRNPYPLPSVLLCFLCLITHALRTITPTLASLLHVPLISSFFIFSQFDWICCDGTEGVCMYVCVYVCVCVCVCVYVCVCVCCLRSLFKILSCPWCIIAVFPRLFRTSYPSVMHYRFVWRSFRDLVPSKN